MPCYSVVNSRDGILEGGAYLIVSWLMIQVILLISVKGDRMFKHLITIFIFLFALNIGVMSTPQAIAEPNPSEDPTIVSFQLSTFHDRNNYRIDASAMIEDPQGDTDIDVVKVIDADGGEFNLQYFGSGTFYANLIFGQALPPLGDTQIVAIDKAGNSYTVHKDLTNVVEQLPTVLFPINGALVSDFEPIFDWTDVSDEQSTIAYSISVYNHDTGEAIWHVYNISESQTRFNFDGNANETLQEGGAYDLEIMAFDTLTNTSYDFITFPVGNYKYLENDLLSIKFHPIRPKAVQFTQKANNETIYGDMADEMFYASVFYQGNFYDIEPSLDSISQTSNQICYHMRVDIEANTAVTFDLSYLLVENIVEVTFGNINEEPGYRLVYVRSPDLLTIRSTQPGAKLIFPYAEGRLIDIATSDPGYVDLDIGYDGWIRPLQMGMLYYDGLAGIVSYDHLDMTLWERIYDDTREGRLCSIGMTFNYRYAPTNFAEAAFIDVFDSETSELSVKLLFTDDYDGDQDIDWIDGAKVLRDRVEALPDKRYLSSFIIKTCGANILTDRLESIRKLSNLTDRNKIYCYNIAYHSSLKHINGMESDFESHFGTLDEVKEAFQIAASSYNTIFSLEDTYTLDYFPGIPIYDPDLRVIYADGTPVENYPPDGFSEVSFWADPYDFAVQKGLDRVRRAVERYPIRETFHIDVLSLVVPKDYSPNSPSSRERNRRGLQLIINEFAKSGVNITSEGLTGYFVESGIGWFLDTPRILTNNHPFSNAEIIPLIEFIFHGKTLYGLYPDIYPAEIPPEEVKINAILEPLLLGANSASHIDCTESNDLEIDKFYLIDLPWMTLNQRFMHDYETNGSYRKVTYDSDTFVEIDYKNDTYTVQVDGRVIAKNYKTVYQKDEDTILVFSRNQQTVSEVLPSGWYENISLQKLTEDGYKDNIPFEYSDQTIIFNADANTPYKILKVQASDDSNSDDGGGSGGGGCFLSTMKE